MTTDDVTIAQSTWRPVDRRKSAGRARRTTGGRVRHRQPRGQYGSTTAISGVDLEIYKNVITAVYRSFRLRKEHLHPLPEPHERSGARSTKLKASALSGHGHIR